MSIDIDIVVGYGLKVTDTILSDMGFDVIQDAVPEVLEKIGIAYECVGNFLTGDLEYYWLVPLYEAYNDIAEDISQHAYQLSRRGATITTNDYKLIKKYRRW